MYKIKTIKELIGDVFIIHKDESWTFDGTPCIVKRKLRTLTDEMEISSLSHKATLTGFNLNSKIRCVTMSENPEYFL